MVADIRTELLLEGIWKDQFILCVPLVLKYFPVPPCLGPIHDYVALLPTDCHDKNNNVECSLTITLNIFNSV